MKRTFLIVLTVAALNAAASVDSLIERARASLKQARATDSADALADAESAVEKALLIAPDDFMARKLEVRVLLARGKFREALAKAKPLNQGTPDDVEAWGLVSDAALGVGDFSEAEHAAQWMINLRATNPAGLERGARLREQSGDLDGAREYWQSALRLSFADDEEHAWIATRLAALHRRTGRSSEAQALLREVLAAMPGYRPALAEWEALRGAH